MLAILQLTNKIALKKESQVPLKDLGHDSHRREFELQTRL